MTTRSMSDAFILGAIETGYTADRSGKVYSPAGKEIGIGQRKKSGHLSVTLRVDGINARGYQSVLVHRFVAAYHLGAAALEEPCIRHLNDIPDDNRIENLAPGTKSQNRRDIAPERLSQIGKANAPALIARSRKLTDTDILSMRADRTSTGDSYAKIAERFGITTMTAYRAINQQSWKDVA